MFEDISCYGCQHNSQSEITERNTGTLEEENHLINQLQALKTPLFWVVTQRVVVIS
jgi:organic radical activating enzyme